MRYQYAGPGPIEVISGGEPIRRGDVREFELIRPGDVREYDAAPDWGPWDLLDGPDTEPAGAPPAPVQVPPPNIATNVLQPNWPGLTPPVTTEGNK